MRLAGMVAIAAALCAAAMAARAGETDIEGAKDHPMVQRFPGSVITEAVVRDFEEFSFPVADGEERVKTKHVEGRFTWIEYDLPKSSSCTQVTRNYERAFQEQGLQTHKGQDRNYVGDYQWHAGKWVSAEGMPKGAKGTVYVFYSCTGSGGDSGKLAVVESQEMEQKVALDSSAMQAEIEKTGHVALHGINFETGKASITPDSATTLQQIADLLSRNDGWKLRIEGHTDDVGKAGDNLVLSRKRAEAVRDWLVANAKIAAARLDTKGFGDSKPVAANDSDDGRAKNRRVELVKI
ncbi:MAG: OmpA family protein [Myxococcales bacterium]